MVNKKFCIKCGNKTINVTIGFLFSIVIIGIIGFYLAWKENFMNIREFVSLGFTGIKGIIGVVWIVLAGITLYKFIKRDTKFRKYLVATIILSICILILAIIMAK